MLSAAYNVYYSGSNPKGLSNNESCISRHVSVKPGLSTFLTLLLSHRLSRVFVGSLEKQTLNTSGELVLQSCLLLRDTKRLYFFTKKILCNCIFLFFIHFVLLNKAMGNKRFWLFFLFLLLQPGHIAIIGGSKTNFFLEQNTE